MPALTIDRRPTGTLLDIRFTRRTTGRLIARHTRSLPAHRPDLVPLHLVVVGGRYAICIMWQRGPSWWSDRTLR